MSPSATLTTASGDIWLRRRVATGFGGTPGVACRKAAHAHTPHAPPLAAPSTSRRSVHLKSLTVKGFKSFASATTLNLE
jgi:hypothetical protein